VPDGEQWRGMLVAGSAAQLAEAFAAYRELGVGDLSVVVGHDDASAMRTLEVAARRRAARNARVTTRKPVPRTQSRR